MALLHTADGSEIRDQLTSWYGEYPIVYRVLYIPGGAEFLPSTVWVTQVIIPINGSSNNPILITIVAAHLVGSPRLGCPIRKLGSMVRINGLWPTTYTPLTIHQYKVGPAWIPIRYTTTILPICPMGLEYLSTMIDPINLSHSYR